MTLAGCNALLDATGSWATKGTFVTTTHQNWVATQAPGAPPPRAAEVAAAAEWTGGSDGTGVLAVGNHPVNGTTLAIPPGRYDVALADATREGSWMICDSPLCGPAFKENSTAVGHPAAANKYVISIGPRSRTLWIDNVTVTPATD